jgi:hypothetical protein
MQKKGISSLTIAAALAVIVVAFAAAGTIDHADALEAEAIAKEARAARAAAEAVQEVGGLSLPLQFDASVTQSLPSGRGAETRYYTRASAPAGK